MASNRPATANPLSRPLTAPKSARPETANTRPDTAASSISNLSDAPNTFKPDLENYQEVDEAFDAFPNVDEEDEDEDEDVFAYSRPQTGKSGGKMSAGKFSPSAMRKLGTSSSLSSGSVSGNDEDSLRLNTARSIAQSDAGGLGVLNVSSAPSSFPHRDLRGFLTTPGGGKGLIAHSLDGASVYTDNSEMFSAYSSTTGGDNRKGSLVHRHNSPSMSPNLPQSDFYGSSTVVSSQMTPPKKKGGKFFSARESLGVSERWQMSELGGPTTIPDNETTYMGGDSSTEDTEKSSINADLTPDEDSKYPEVRAAVSNLDDPEMPALTFRVWSIGLVLCSICSGINTFLYFRQPAPAIPPILIQLLAYPIGKFMAYVLPFTTYHLPRWLGNYSFSLNPGPFNIKEHGLISIMATVTSIQAYGLQAAVAAEIYYKVPFPAGFSVLLVLSSQLTGFAMAGFTRKLLIIPASMIWPQALIICTFLNTFHAEEDGYDGSLTRFKFFWIIFGAAFAWYFFPGFIFGALSYFTWICWIRPNNVVVNQLFGGASGLGMSVISFDWSQIAWIGSPLVIPWWAEANIGFGFLLFYWIIVPILYYTNTWGFAYLPMVSSGAFDRFGASYNYSAILDENQSLDLGAYAAYSPLYISVSFAMTYFLAIALTTCVIVHTALFQGKKIWTAVVRRMNVEEDDVHAKLMKAYPEVPNWWFYASFGLVLALSLIAVECYQTDFPWWGLFLSLALTAIYFVPAGYIFAQTGQQITVMNVISQVIPGYIWPGEALPGLFFKTYAVETLFMGGVFTQSLKIGHYIKIPPRDTFIVQFVSVFLTSLIQVGIKEWMFRRITDICSPTNESGLTCPHAEVFFTASILWALIGPQRQFGPGAVYHPIYYAFILGALIPIPFYIWARKEKSPKLKNFLEQISWPVILNGPLGIPPATGLNYSSWLTVGFLTQYVARRKNFRWWSKYNYILSAALDSGTVLSTVFIFLTLGIAKNGTLGINWWGNTVFQNTLDWNGAAYKEPPLEGFGPGNWPV